ncbi:DUF6924 domain-containing protein [Streptomyces olivochromogenes]|uniref:DUF6924 domain-containing protein n=1 Tax=Streptomyces olivochromogenes TaxID=1963 RepID=UPI001F318A19|nr:hypothetical protein [Streptomyces olivochromogenes]MCF3130362.1 hypothetical protein [Streptomyces olivochromogenes]
MNQLPCSDDPLMVRTDFSRAASWEGLLAALDTPTEDGFLAHVEPLDDRRFAGVTREEAIALLPDAYEHPLLVLADATALGSTDLPLLVIDLVEERGRAIRVVAAELWGIENNLSLSNMYFEEFAGAVDEDGVYRGL